MGPMLRWFVFTVTLGLLPFGFSVLLQWLRGIPPEQWQNSPELLFFSVMVSASQLGEIFAALSARVGRPAAWRTFLSMMFGLFLISAILSAALYGVYVDHERHKPAHPFAVECADRAGGTRSPDRAGTADVDAACAEWFDFQGNLFRFSIWMSAIVGAVGTFTEWVRTRRHR